MRVLAVEHRSDVMSPPSILATAVQLGSQVDSEELKSMQAEGWLLFLRRKATN